MKRITLKDIASKAGVHVTTVSLALRNHPRIPVPTRKRLQKMASEMGYRRDPMLTALSEYRDANRANRRTMTFAYLTWWSSPFGWKKVWEDPPFRNLLYDGARRQAESLGISLDHFSLAERGMTARRLDQIFRARGIQGILAASFLERNQTLQLSWPRYAYVKIDNSPIETPAHKVRSDTLAAVQGAYRTARERGYKRIGLAIRRIWNEKNDDFILMGFLRAQTICEDEGAIPPFVHEAKRPHQAFSQWFDLNRPDVVVSLDPFFLPLARMCGIRIPDDVAYLSFDNKCESGEIAGFRQRHREVGAAAVDLIAAMINRNEFGLPKIPQTLNVPPVWVEGRSLPIHNLNREHQPLNPAGNAIE